MRLLQSAHSPGLSFPHRYAIDRRTDMDHLFNVHPGNGSVFLLKGLDREESAWHNISVVATELRKCRRRRRPEMFTEMVAARREASLCCPNEKPPHCFWVVR